VDDLRKKRALVCGGTRGIGRACAFELANRGASVTIAARDAAALERVRAEVPAIEGATHGTICVDFSDPQRAGGEVVRHIGEHRGFDILVNNSGGPAAGPIVDASADAFSSAFASHLIANHLLVQAVLPAMRAAGYGRIVNIVSTSVVQPIKGLGVSNTIRAAVANWARTLAAEVGGDCVTVNNVLPGFTATDRLKSIIDTKASKRGVDASVVERDMIASIPLKRFATPEEIAAVVGFLASPAASYISGVSIPVDGGRLATQS